MICLRTMHKCCAIGKVDVGCLEEVEMSACQGCTGCNTPSVKREIEAAGALSQMAVPIGKAYE